MAGVRIIYIEQKNKGPHHVRTPSRTKSREIIVDILSQVSKESDMFSIYPEIDSYADLMMTAVSSQFRGIGLAKEMYKRALALIQSYKIPVCCSIIANPWALKVCKSLGFKEHFKLYLKTYLDKETGTQVFKEAKEDECIVCVSLSLPTYTE